MTTLRQGRAGAARLLVVVASAVGLAACNTDRLLDVAAPSQVPSAIFDDPAQASLMVNSARSDFECAFAAFVLVEGVISDELGDAQLGAAGWDYDRRSANLSPGGLYGTGSCESNQLPGIYVPISTARFAAERALTKLQGWTDAQVPNRAELIATAALYTGFSYTMMGMSMCEAAFDLEAPIDQAAMFARAEEFFTTAIDQATATGQSDVRNAALVGRARVRLFQQNLQGAAADAGQVPEGFVFNATYAAGDNRTYNRVYAATAQYNFYTVEPQNRAITTEGVTDPRTLVEFAAPRGMDPKTPIYAPSKYDSDDSPIPVARYEEAQLILAEIAGGSTEVNIINALRDAEGLPHYSGATDATSLAQLLANERARVLFVEGFRNYDIQRWNLPLVPAPGTAFPNKGGTYGNTTCLPVPDIERFNNPNVG